MPETPCEPRLKAPSGAVYLEPVEPGLTAEGYVQMLDLAKKRGYTFSTFAEVADASKQIFLRHDLDMSLDVGLRLAELEAREKARSTYFVLLTSPLYNPFSASSRQTLRKIRDLGHDVGLHFDPMVHKVEGKSELFASLDQEVNQLSMVLGEPVRFISFHQPSPWVLGEDIVGDNYESVYNSRFISKMRYISDSTGRWRAESIFELLERDSESHIQFLSHPGLWLSGSGKSLNDRIWHLVDEKQRSIPSQFEEAINSAGRGLTLFDPSHISLRTRNS